MPRIGYTSNTWSRLRQISNPSKAVRRQSFAISPRRRWALDDHSNLSEANHPVRLVRSKDRAHGGHGAGSQGSHSNGDAWPSNPNNARDGVARNRDAQDLQRRRKEDPEAQHRLSPFGVRQTTVEATKEELAVDAARATSPPRDTAPATGAGQSSETRQRRLRQFRSNHVDSEDDTSSVAPQPPAPQAVPNQVGIFLDGQPVSLSPVLLRDLCECPSCIDPSTKQKLFSTADIPSDIKATALAQDAESISLVWEHDVSGYEEGHTTVLDMDNIRALRDSEGARSANSHYQPGKQLIWDAEQYRQLEDFEYEEYMQDERTLHRALRQLHTYGMLFVRGVPEDEKSVSTIAERIGPVKNTFYGYTWDVRSVPEAKNVAYTSQDLGFHMDLLYMHQPPHLQFLHCIRSSATGGASLFADSYKAAADLLSMDIRAFLELATLPASFHYNHPSSHLYHQSHLTIKISQLDDRFSSFADFARSYRATTERFTLHQGRRRQSRAMDAAEALQKREMRIEDYIENVAWSPPFQAPFRDPNFKPINPSVSRLAALNQKVNRWHAAANKLNGLIHRESGMYERMMRPGECVIFDNRRVLHARRAFDAGDTGKERWLRGAYLDWDPFWSKMRVLGRKYGRGDEFDEMGGLIQEIRR